MAPKPTSKQRIVAAAKPLLARFGFAKTSVDELARAAHVSKATLYAHFGSKEGLIAAVLRDEAKRLDDEKLVAVANETTYANKLRALLLAHVRGLRRLANLHQITLEALAEILPMVGDVTEDIACAARDGLEALIAEGVEAKAFRVTNSKRIAAALDLAMNSLDFLLPNARSADDLDQTAADLIDLLVAGLSAPDKEGA